MVTQTALRPHLMTLMNTEIMEIPMEATKVVKEKMRILLIFPAAAKKYKKTTKA